MTSTKERGRPNPVGKPMLLLRRRPTVRVQVGDRPEHGRATVTGVHRDASTLVWYSGSGRAYEVEFADEPVRLDGVPLAAEVAGLLGRSGIPIAAPAPCAAGAPCQEDKWSIEAWDGLDLDYRPAEPGSPDLATVTLRPGEPLTRPEPTGTDQNGDETTYAYDADGNVITETDRDVRLGKWGGGRGGRLRGPRRVVGQHANWS